MKIKLITHDNLKEHLKDKVYEAVGDEYSAEFTDDGKTYRVAAREFEIINLDNFNPEVKQSIKSEYKVPTEAEKEALKRFLDECEALENLNQE